MLGRTCNKSWTAVTIRVLTKHKHTQTHSHHVQVRVQGLFSTLILKMISHNDLYNLANTLGALAMVTVVAYHVVAVNARHLQEQALHADKTQ
ncbi:hypothetical protein BKA93DRAFT_823807 [Sparassis latifolia]